MKTQNFKIGWIDFSEESQNKVDQALEFLSESDTVDELGLGRVRSVFADRYITPGLTTIQTKLRYFLFVPWCFIEVEKRTSGDESIDELHQELIKVENELIDALDSNVDGPGIIGINAGADSRPASRIYWSGLKKWGIALQDLSRTEYLMAIRAKKRQHEDEEKYFDNLTDEDSEIENKNLLWHPEVRDLKPEEFPSDDTTFELVSEKSSSDESEFISDRIILGDRTRKSLLGEATYQIQDSSQFIGAEYPWATNLELSEDLHKSINVHAKNFSVAMWGADLLYRWLVFDRVDRKDSQNKHEERLIKEDDEDSWWNLFSKHRDGQNKLSDWNLTEFWNIVHKNNPRVRPSTKKFISDWCEIILDINSPGELMDSSEARERLKKREGKVKGRKKARLWNKEAARRLKGTNPPNPMKFRWELATDYLEDLEEGITG